MVLVTSSGEEEDGSVHETVLDYKGNSVDKSKTGGWLAAGLILGTELSERICVMGISMNLVTYLVYDLKIPSAKSATIVTNFMGTLNLLGLLGGFLADAKLGRYSTVAVFATITALGVMMLTVATTLPSMRPPVCDGSKREQHLCTETNGKQLALLYAALYTVALGGGGIKSNVSGFGSDQFDHRDPKEEKSMIFFFNRFYFAISIGSLFAVIVLVYIQDNVGRGWGYGISAGTMVIAVVVLMCGTPWYRYKKAQGSPLTIIWRVLLLAWQKRNLPQPSDPSLLNEYEKATIPYSQKLRCLDKAAIVYDKEARDADNINTSWFVSTVTEVEEVKMVARLIPIWSTSILFWTIYSQMTTFTVEQATAMDRKLGSFQIPAASYATILFVTILLFTSLNERVFVPFARRITRKPQGITSLQRIGIGLVFSMAAMVAAGIIEKQRRRIAVEEHRDINAFWLAPQYFLVGAGEGFAYVGQLEFFIRESPERMKSMSTGFFLSSISMGFFVSSLLVTIVVKITGKKWIMTNLNGGRLDNFYWLLAVLGFVNFLIFLAVARKHRYKVQHPTILEEQGQKELKSLNEGTQDVEKNGTIKIEYLEKIEA
ncbi:hypothetical protein ACFE04_018176 [Oxalis oulophora]